VEKVRSKLLSQVCLSDVLFLASAFGLLSGLVEGATLLLLQKSRWAGGTIDIFLVPRRILYVSPLADLFLFVAVALLTAALWRLLRRGDQTQAVLFMLIFMLVFDWLSIALDLVIDPPVIVILSAGISVRLAVLCRKKASWLFQAARRAVPALALGVLAVFAGVQAQRLAGERSSSVESARERAGAPNVLILVMDTVRADRVSALGYQRPTTPNLAQLASQGVLFESAFSTSSWTLPAHASLLTGRFPFEHGAEFTEYDGRYPTLAEAFQARGYRTAAFSANTFFFTPQVGLGRGFSHFDAMFCSLADALMRPLYGRSLVILYEQATYGDVPGRQNAADINENFLSWLGNGSEKPFFAVLNYFDAHAPYLPPVPFRSRFSIRPDPGGILNVWGDRETLERPDQKRDESDAYDGAIAYEDAQIGQLLQSLRLRHLAQNTLVVVTADHGEFFGEHNLYLHQKALYLPGIHIPLIVSWPGHVPSGIRVEAPVSLASVPATVTDVIPGKDSIHFPGLSLAGYWNGSGVQQPASLILSELVTRTHTSTAHPDRRIESLLSGKWHFIQKQGESPQLFDWRADPSELHNLAASAEGAPVAASLSRCLNAHRETIREVGCGLTAPSAGSIGAGGAQ
jgi:arylsulfatase A-like enzyme